MAQSPITTKGAVLFKVEDGVGVVTFNQPENNNALSAAIFVGLMRRGAARNVHGTRLCVATSPRDNDPSQKSADATSMRPSARFFS